jgi:hypothetical protein
MTACAGIDRATVPANDVPQGLHPAGERPLTRGYPRDQCAYRVPSSLHARDLEDTGIAS